MTSEAEIVRLRAEIAELKQYIEELEESLSQAEGDIDDLEKELKEAHTALEAGEKRSAPVKDKQGRVLVESSMLRSVGYDAKTQILELEFNSGKVYQYFDVSRKVHRDLMKADSKGSYFQAMIAGAFDYVQVTNRRRSR